MRVISLEVLLLPAAYTFNSFTEMNVKLFLCLIKYHNGKSRGGIPQFRHLFAEFSPQGPVFNPCVIHVRCIVREMALWQIQREGLGYSPANYHPTAVPY
jgi:hypothetical protein